MSTSEASQPESEAQIEPTCEVAVVTPEVLAPEREEEPVKPLRSSTLLHPVSGLVVLGLDNALFGANVVTLGWATPLVCLFAFFSASLGVFLVQKLQARDGFFKSVAKAVFCGIFAGMPTSIMGTALGALIILLSGLSRFQRGKVTGK